MAALWRWEEGSDAIREAVEIDRQLANDHPDDFLPGLAASLTTSAEILGHLGKQEQRAIEALEAAEIYKQLAVGRPTEFVVDLARSLNNLALVMMDLKRWAIALDASDKGLCLP